MAKTRFRDIANGDYFAFTETAPRLCKKEDLWSYRTHPGDRYDIGNINTVIYVDALVEASRA